VLDRVGDERFALHPGEHVVGRDPDVEESGSTPRRVTAVTRGCWSGRTGTVLEDFGSRTARIAARPGHYAHPARDGDEIPHRRRRS
jgi:hypothetical protein